MDKTKKHSSSYKLGSMVFIISMFFTSQMHHANGEDALSKAWYDRNDLTESERDFYEHATKFSTEIIEFATKSLFLATKKDFISRFGCGLEEENLITYVTSRHAFPSDSIAPDLMLLPPIAWRITLYFNKEEKLMKIEIE